jgi:hypothetical protein
MAQKIGVNAWYWAYTSHYLNPGHTISIYAFGPDISSADRIWSASAIPFARVGGTSDSFFLTTTIRHEVDPTGGRRVWFDVTNVGSGAGYCYFLLYISYTDSITDFGGYL